MKSKPGIKLLFAEPFRKFQSIGRPKPGTCTMVHGPASRVLLELLTPEKPFDGLLTLAIVSLEVVISNVPPEQKNALLLDQLLKLVLAG